MGQQVKAPQKHEIFTRIKDKKSNSGLWVISWNIWLHFRSGNRKNHPVGQLFMRILTWYRRIIEHRNRRRLRSAYSWDQNGFLTRKDGKFLFILSWLNKRWPSIIRNLRRPRLCYWWERWFVRSLLMRLLRKSLVLDRKIVSIFVPIDWHDRFLIIF